MTTKIALAALTLGCALLTAGAMAAPTTPTDTMGTMHPAVGGMAAMHKPGKHKNKPAMGGTMHPAGNAMAPAGNTMTPANTIGGSH